jgi:hypothetical protein
MNQIPTPLSSTPRSAADLPINQNYQIPNKMLHEAFGELNITPKNDRLEIVLTILMQPVKEGSQTGVALDGSASMQSSFGRGWSYSSNFDNTLIERFKKEGKAKAIIQDGNSLLEYTNEGWQELIKHGYLEQTKNIVEPIARDMIPHLADKIDADGGTTLIYWACGQNGDKIEEAGDLTSDEARVANYNGPKDWGFNTQLLPAVKYFVERFHDAEWGFYVFITDGSIDDLQAVKDYTADLSRRIGAGKAKPVKCVLIGIGADVDQKQMEQLDDLPEELDLPVDIWDHKIAEDMRNLRDIFAEVVDEAAIVAPVGRVIDDKGNVATNYSDGVPTLLRFSLPTDSKFFTLEVGGNQVKQNLFES